MCQLHGESREPVQRVGGGPAPYARRLKAFSTTGVDLRGLFTANWGYTAMDTTRISLPHFALGPLRIRHRFIRPPALFGSLCVPKRLQDMNVSPALFDAVMHIAPESMRILNREEAEGGMEEPLVRDRAGLQKERAANAALSLAVVRY